MTSLSVQIWRHFNPIQAGGGGFRPPKQFFYNNFW